MKLNELLLKINTLDKVPTGYKTARQWSAEWKRGISSTKDILSQAIAAKVGTRKIFRVLDANGVPRPTPHFILKK